MTPHNEANSNDIAPVVLMPGDPLRAKYIAETYLTDSYEFNHVRGMLGYTGYYKGQRVSVMGSGMGMPSIGIYAYELYHFYNVETIIRVGSCGAMQEDINIRDLIIAQGASTDSSFSSQYRVPGTLSAISNYDLLEKAVSLSKKKNLTYHVGQVLSSDYFYNANPDASQAFASMNILAVEMEAYALYLTAAYANKKALAILTVSDSLITHQETTSEEREKSFNDMIEVALETVVC